MQIEKQKTLSSEVIFIDGLWGTGKSLLGPIVSGMSGVEKVKIEHIYEYTSVLAKLNKIEPDAAVWLLKNYSDMSQYNNLIGREVNLRWKDDSGFLNNPGSLKYLYRIFSSDGDHRINSVNNANYACGIMSHMIMLAPDYLKPAFEKRVKIIEMVRHPLYMVQHVANFLSRFDVLRNFTISTYYCNVKIPWFAYEWRDEYVAANNLERAVLSISRLYSKLDENLNLAKQFELSVLVLPFERATFETHLMLKELEDFLERKHHKSLGRILKKQKIPRDTSSAGLGYARYGWRPTKLSEADTYLELATICQAGCSKKIYDELVKVINWYELKYPSLLNQFQMI